VIAGIGRVSFHSDISRHDRWWSSSRNRNVFHWSNSFGCVGSANRLAQLVPSGAVGGDIVRARLAAIKGAPLSVAAGTVIVDLTLGVFITAGFTILGLLLLVHVTGQTSFVGRRWLES